MHTITRPSPPRPQSRADGDSRSTTRGTIEVWLAVFLPLVFGLQYNLWNQIQAGHVVALLLLPVWASAAIGFRGYRLVAGLSVLSVVSGAVLTEFARVDHDFYLAAFVANSAEVLGIALLVGGLLWSRRVIGAPLVAILFAAAAIVHLIMDGALSSEDPWRMGFSFPVTTLVLALAWKTGSPVVGLVATAAISLVPLLGDVRSGSAILIMVAMLVLWQMRPTSRGRRASTARTLIGFGVLGSIVYSVVQAAILGGYLGEHTQERSEMQIETSGTLLLGGRPEAGASVALLTHQPLGYGQGVLANFSDILVAKTGMSALGYQPNNGYVENYMFGSGYEVHSIIGNLWIQFGLPGAALAISIVVLVFLALSHRLAHRSGSAAFLFLSVILLWDLLFSPIHSSLPSMILFLAVGLVAREDIAQPRHPAPLGAPHAHGSDTGAQAQTIRQRARKASA
ncbi:hypothetical protein [Labedella endophytica]|uniref:O-antigen ligase domain-containing protein n=1 Tax=Labedella endophytica TaxID=1523160 RepID=A0A3S0VIP0_9MICO|nr:hypothetical protein [Labedella endophytica]RUR03476.1 hypothetical protein ELQ94_02740 [Labedella endophytica]